MKLIITSPWAIIDIKRSSTENIVYFNNILEELNYFKSLEAGNEVLVISSDKSLLRYIPDDYRKFPVEKRGGKELIEEIMQNTPYQNYSNIFMLGANDLDFYTATNSKLFLLTAFYAKNNNPTARIFNYGLPITDPRQLRTFLNHFSQISSPWYYKLQVSEKTTLFALTGAESMVGDDAQFKDMNSKFRACLKDGRTTYRDLFIIYFLMSTYAVAREMRDTNYWDIYPASTPELNETLNLFKEKAKDIYKGSARAPIFIKTTTTRKRHTMDKPSRIADGCDSQFDSIHLNPYYKKKLQGKQVCIIDDFTRFGTSCETARILLEEAGVAKVIFIALGKFARDYYKYNYQIEGDIFGNYKATKLGMPQRLENGNYNVEAKKEYLDSLRGLI